ncbi:thioredoxin [uncultured Albimonas sp.]|uniref:thioredoxin n=1 Tax=uncultured Albimonas sp. TaxID=1331701 RepID=UPI0030EEF170|tara:strand:- start:936 stop:1856 length:921 start_codon:yes stop_codon:yes gene_type:complete
MLELGQGQAAAPAGGDLIKDVNEATFMADVVEASREVPVIVDFWAPWCGPCKQLTPALEQAVTAAGGKVRLVKVNVDENQMIAGQLRVQSIPTVYGFVDGQPVDGFMGAVPPSELKAFVDKLIGMAGGETLADAVAAAEEMLEQGQAEDAVQVFAAILEEDPENLAALGGLARAFVALGRLDEAEAALTRVHPAKTQDAAISHARAQIELARMTEGGADASETDALRARLEADPNDHEARLELAKALIAAREHDAAVDELLDLFRRDREWNEGAAKAQLTQLFESLGPKDPLVGKGRRRLASMIFA